VDEQAAEPLTRFQGAGPVMFIRDVDILLLKAGQGSSIILSKRFAGL